MSHNPQSTIVIETDIARQMRMEREDANYVSLGQVNYGDLNHWVINCRRLKDKESFDTAIRILVALKDQVVGK